MSGQPQTRTGMTVELAYRLAIEDIREGLRAQARVSAAARRSRWLTTVAAVLLLGVVIWMWVADGTVETRLVVIPPALLAARLGMPWLVARQFHRRAEAMGEHRAVVDDDGITITSRQQSSSLTWQAVTRYTETPRAFVLFGGERNVTDLTILPKRGAAHPADAERLRTLIEGRLARA